MSHPPPRYRRPRALVAAYPGVALIPIAWLWILVDPLAWGPYSISVALLALACGAEIRRVRRVRRRASGPLARLLPALVFLVAVGCLRQAGGGFPSGVGILALLPVFQAALFGRDRRELWAMLSAMTVLYLAPIIVIGGSRYPPTQFRASLLVVALSLVIGLATQELVERVRRDASDAQVSRWMLEQVSGLVHDLFVSRDVRADLSAGALRIAGASVALLFERDGETARLRATAFAGVPATEVSVELNDENPIGWVFLNGRPKLVERITESQLAAPEIWHASGRPETALYQPLVRGKEVIGVLGVGWRGEDHLGLNGGPELPGARVGGVEGAPDGGWPADRRSIGSRLAGVDGVTGPRASVVSLLAHEAAIVLDRVDRVTALTDMAETDALTGLANRRVWDHQIARALREGCQITIALLDIDHFKRFNDTLGHPAGDRLLRETSAAWRELVRAGDLLARLGGEEFGLLLLDCELDDATEVTERLRDTMPGGETCSAGLAVRHAEEPIESVIARADRALYDAKSAGRDVARIAV